jgi:hypothetical protein
LQMGPIGCRETWWPATTFHRLTSQKSEGVNYAAAEAWHLAQKELFRQWLEGTDETQKLRHFTQTGPHINPTTFPTNKHMRSATLAEGQK